MKRPMLERLLEEAASGILECRGCGDALEPDAPECGACGWENPLVREGLI